ncbi:MAG: hypothetical protein K8R90_05690 [Candidatus Cloacimonetes bacterium]|nr:hypothetical protein [Candidatus Cloacimonadota bacterium]
MGRYAIFVVFGLFLTMNYFVISSHKSERIAIKSTVEHLNRRIAQNVATGYANITLNRLRVDQVGITGFAPEEYYINDELERPDGAVIVLQVDNYESDPALEIGEYRITSTVDYEDVNVQTVVFDRQLPFSYWALFVNSFPRYYYGNGEGADGPVHINGKMRVGQNPGPQWLGNVTTTQGVAYYAGANAGNYTGFHGDNNNFSHRGITLPTHLGLTAAAIASSHKIDPLFAGSSSSFVSVVLNRAADGTQYIELADVLPTDPRLLRAAWATDAEWNAFLAQHTASVKLGDITSGILYSSAFDLRVRGELDGQLTISTENKIYIDDDIYYHDDPRVVDDSDDLLGLMAEDGMIISTSADPHTGIKYNNDYGDASALYQGCTVMGNMYTPSTITIENLRDGCRGDWITVGGRVQEVISATWSGGSHWTGFKEVINYDDRLRKMTPPGIPYTMERRISRWQETF